MKCYKLNFIRHGQTDANVNGTFAGTTDVPLNDLGRNTLLELKEEFEYPRAQVVYTSPLSRAKESAEILYDNRLIIEIPELREIHFGIFEGKSHEELINNPDFKEFMASGMKKTPPLGESNADFSVRCIKAINNILADMMARNVTEAAVVAHGGFILRLLTLCNIESWDPKNYFCDNGKGFKVMITPSLWSNIQKFEVLEKIPDNSDAPSWAEYGVYDVEDAEEE